MINEVKNCSKIVFDVGIDSLNSCLALNKEKICDDSLCIYNVPPFLVVLDDDIEV